MWKSWANFSSRLTWIMTDKFRLRSWKLPFQTKRISRHCKSWNRSWNRSIQTKMENLITQNFWHSPCKKRSCSRRKTSNQSSRCWTRTETGMSREQSSRKSSNVTFDVIIENGLNNMNGKSLDEVIMSCDKDGNGIIDYTEFKAAMLIEWAWCSELS